MTDNGRKAGASSALLLLADGRFPSGGHAHSGGLEAAVGLEDVRDVAGLEAFLRGRLATVGVVASAFAAAVCAAAQQASPVSGGDGVFAVLDRLDLELDARTPSPVLRTVSRRLGRQLLRAGRTVWPDAVLGELAGRSARAPHQPVVFGAVAAAAGVGPDDAALAAAQDAVVGPATAGVRLLGLDPFAVHAALARLGRHIDAVARDGARHAHTRPQDLPSRTGPLLDICAEHHATWEVRLFAS